MSQVVRIRRANGEVEEIPVQVTQVMSRDLFGRPAWQTSYEPSITISAGDEIFEMPGVHDHDRMSERRAPHEPH